LELVLESQASRALDDAPADERLMQRVRAGEREALSALFHRHQKPLFNFFLRGCGHTEEAEDLAMETLVRVFQRAEQFRGGSFKAWMYRMALNVLRDKARSSRRRPEVTASSVETTWALLEDGREEQRPEAMAMRAALAATVREAVHSLPERERTALVLREYQQLTYDEIAAALGASLPAVKMLIFRARERVRKRLGEEPAGGREVTR
jgi:RNA polymerase sigma-70 factor (ECF subfamily)